MACDSAYKYALCLPTQLNVERNASLVKPSICKLATCGVYTTEANTLCVHLKHTTQLSAQIHLQHEGYVWIFMSICINVQVKTYPTSLPLNIPINAGKRTGDKWTSVSLSSRPSPLSPLSRPPPFTQDLDC